MRICLIYDCLYPYTVGGAERWYRALADELVRAGHEVTYLTRRQWEVGTAPEVPGVRVVAVSPDEPLYDEAGRRRIAPPLRFGAGVARHLLQNRHRYDALHSGAFPYFALLGARLALAGRPIPIGVDWFEVWSPVYWREYLGAPGGFVGRTVQRLCVRATDRAFVFSDLHARRLRAEGLRSEPIRLSGLYGGPLAAHERDGASADRPPLVVFAGRHIPEKRVETLPAAIMAARAKVPGLRGLILGDGPRREAVIEAIAGAGAGAFVEAPGFVPAGEVADALAAATCHVLPSAREGYGLVVIEAAANGTPSVVVRGEDNAAAELVTDGLNGFVAPSHDALADAIVAVHDGGHTLRERTRRWFEENAPSLQAVRSAQQIVEVLGR